jgi:hypothetical protein
MSPVGSNSNWVLMKGGSKIIGSCCQPDPTVDITQGVCLNILEYGYTAKLNTFGGYWVLLVRDQIATV